METNLLDGLKTEPKKVIATIEAQSKKVEDISNYQKEFKEKDRKLRDTQVGKTQVDKPIAGGNIVKAVRIPINFAKKIVTTATAFEVGKPVTLIPSEENDLSKLIYQIWKINRIDAAIQKIVSLKKSETQAAIQFYIADSGENSLLNKVLSFFKLNKQVKEIKSKVLDNTQGQMTPYFGNNGNMELFMWKYKASQSGKEFNIIEIWDELNYHKLSDQTGDLVYEGPKVHGFDRIPIVYVSQEQPEWFEVKELIDRYETTLSKLGNSNDYTAYPILLIHGDIKTLPNKDDNGKIINLPMKKDESGNWIKGGAEFLVSSNSAESSKLEFDSLKELIYSISHTPDLSFDNVKGLGSVSGVALKLLFLDAVIKATMNEGENRTMIERIINVIMSGIIKTTNTTLSGLGSALYYDIVFNSIIPDDVKTATDIIISLKEAGLLSAQSAIKLIDMVENPEEELNLINSEKATEPNTEVQ